MHKTAYGDDVNQALALPSVGIEASPARENRKRIRRRIRLFRHATPYRPPIGNGRRNRPDDPAPGRDGISTDSTHPPIPVGIVVVPYLRNAPVRRFSAPLAGFRPKRRRMGRASPPSAPTGPPTGYGGSTRAEERRSVAASSHSPWLPPTHKALVTLEKTSRWNRRKGQGTTCPQRICLQAMRR